MRWEGRLGREEEDRSDCWEGKNRRDGRGYNIIV
jgi:hypothetical protein